FGSAVFRPARFGSAVFRPARFGSAVFRPARFGSAVFRPARFDTAVSRSIGGRRIPLAVGATRTSAGRAGTGRPAAHPVRTDATP
ncbi:hypothetical protein, partial [Micromonospora sp. NPDC007230]|uniref:hypothetical protein n=1 Tax=Micromonospora sp. NPDC007230 TaxID=3364237 RepID=UPI003690FAB3